MAGPIVDPIVIGLGQLDDLLAILLDFGFGPAVAVKEGHGPLLFDQHAENFRGLLVDDLEGVR